MASPTGKLDVAADLITLNECLTKKPVFGSSYTLYIEQLLVVRWDRVIRDGLPIFSGSPDSGDADILGTSSHSVSRA